MDKLEWRTEQRKVKDLIPYEKNPRKISDEQVRQLKESLEKFNVVEIPAIDTDNKLIAGHQRVKILMMLNRGDEEIDVRVPNRKLTKEEFEEYNIRSNKNTADWDFDILKLFDEDLIEKIGFDDKELFKVIDDDIDFDKIEGNEDREVKTKDMEVTCPECNYNFNIKI